MQGIYFLRVYQFTVVLKKVSKFLSYLLTTIFRDYILNIVNFLLPYFNQCWRSGPFIHRLSAPGSRFYRFILQAPAPSKWPGSQLPRAVFRCFYRLCLLGAVFKNFFYRLRLSLKRTGASTLILTKQTRP